MTVLGWIIAVILIATAGTDRPEDEECARLAGLDFRWAVDWRAEIHHG